MTRFTFPKIRLIGLNIDISSRKLFFLLSSSFQEVSGNCNLSLNLDNTFS